MRRDVALAVMVGSGFAGLGYQIVWTQQGALWLGHEAAAMLAVVAAFFGGLAAGAHVLAPYVECSARPLRWYGACELAIGAWSLVLALALPRASEALLGLIGPEPDALRHWAIAFGGTFVLLLPATAAMGATLPAIERELRAAGWGATTVARLYAGNTAGAVVGVLVGALVLIPQAGLVRTAAICAAVNLLCAAAAWLSPASEHGDTASPQPTARAARGAAVLAATGFLGVAYEVLVVRVLSQVAEDTVYTFALALAVYLLGTAAGAAAYAAFGARRAAVRATTGRLLSLQAAACLVGVGFLWSARDVHDALLAFLGGGVAGAIAVEAALAVFAFLVPTAAMGALFSHLCAQALAGGTTLGRALAANTFGAALAPPIVGVLLAPSLGPKAALLLVVLGYVVLAVVHTARVREFAAPAAATAGLAAFAPPLAFVDVPYGGRIVDYREGVSAAVSVVEDVDGVARLRINDRQQEGSSATRYADGRQALLPLLLHPAPRRALFLGLGTGTSSYSAAAERGLEVTAVELLPEVVAVSGRFAREFGAGAPAPAIVVADARRFVRASERQWDVVVADNFHPARSGSGALYTVEHFEAVRARLAPGGLFCQWLPLHQLDLATLRVIVQSFRVAFPSAVAILATNSLETPVVGLVGGAGVLPLDANVVGRRVASYAGAVPASAYGFDDAFAVLGAVIAGPEALEAFASNAPPNTDDRPIVAYRAPRVTYAPAGLPRTRLAALLDELGRPAPRVLADSGGRDAARVDAYWRARNRFLRAGMRVQPSADPAGMLAQVEAPLLDVLRTSADFRPAYDPLVRLAVAIGDREPERSLALLGELQRLQPARPEAAAAIARLQSTYTSQRSSRPLGRADVTEP